MPENYTKPVSRLGKSAVTQCGPECISIYQSEFQMADIMDIVVLWAGA
jgi:hypothetical protein